MLSGDDLENFGYYENFTDSDEVDWADMYSAFVEKMIMTSGEKRLHENLYGLCAEVGEVHGKVQKSYRDNTEVVHKEIMKELGDVVFYATALANIYGRGLQEVLQLNIEKLDDRQKRGKLKGSGDNR